MGAIIAKDHRVGERDATGICRERRLERQRPLRASPSNAANTAGPSKRGKQNQSIDPSLPTSAAERRSPISAYSSIRFDMQSQSYPAACDDSSGPTTSAPGSSATRDQQRVPARKNACDVVDGGGVDAGTHAAAVGLIPGAG
jgi:hypothetical protein